MIRRNAASDAQVRAADPADSVWLSANAGSGKTRVLTDRVARLLLDGISPQSVLCLTYTKAAASEMQNRLFGRLGDWAMHEEGALRRTLATLGLEGRIDAGQIAGARRLFARAIETPGGLKIQTIHSFCASLLRRFPLEAGVSPQFREMDDRAAKLLRDGIVGQIAEGPDAGALDRLAAHLSGDDLSDLTAEIVKHRTLFEAPADRARLWEGLQVAPGESPERIADDLCQSWDMAAFSALKDALWAGSVNDVKAAEKLAGVDPAAPSAGDLETLETVFLTGAGAKAPFAARIDAFPTVATRRALAAHMPAINTMMATAEALRDRRIRLHAAEKALCLHEFAAVFLRDYRRRKDANGWLDFDDLILRARALLTDTAVAQWVLFRLDGGIDHILVDEAQDTSPAQWDVIERLTQEFTAGKGARDDVRRTVFVVGDKKQSIYSFQGADPEGFDRMRAHFRDRLARARQPFAEMGLEYSFRSAAPILRLVDAVFNQRADNGLGGETRHIAFRAGMPGRVDLWPAIPNTENPASGDWFDPVDRVAENHHMVILASRIADRIAGMIGKATIPEEDRKTGSYRMRLVRAADILILVQRRSELFHELIRACKSRDLPIAGADRLKISAELAVRDITALLSFLATPEDDLSLAAALRSPLLGWSQQELHALAQPRAKGEFLWAALRGPAGRRRETMDILNALRRDADFLRPYDLIERILTRHDGRRRLLARLGPEAEDGIDTLLALALSYEQSDIPSLTGFLTWLASDEVEIRRQPDSAGDRIRVMTVHGAKGLESPIVILPDTAGRNPQVRDEILHENRALYWKTPVNMRPDAMAAAHDALVARRDAERDRLLYVAMTRAEKWLIVAGAGNMGRDGCAWYEQIGAGMKAAGAGAMVSEMGEGLRLDEGAWPDAADEATDSDDPPSPDIPNWVWREPAAPAAAPKPLAPSALGGAKALPGDAGSDQGAAMRRGSLVHLLLEHLPGRPPAQWPALARNLLAGRFADASDTGIKEALAEAESVLGAPGLAGVFAPDALAEVDISANLPPLGGLRIQGSIDRLIVTPDRVLAIDFKTNATVPDTPGDVPDGILRQMGAYYAALAQIYPDRPVEIAILWTGSATLMRIPHDIVIRALDDVVFP